MNSDVMSTRTKMLIHVLIAVLSTIILGLQGYKSFGEIASITMVVTFLNAIVQGLNAAKAFSDTASGRDAVAKEEMNDVESEDEKTKGKTVKSTVLTITDTSTISTPTTATAVKSLSA